MFIQNQGDNGVKVVATAYPQLPHNCRATSVSSHDSIAERAAQHAHMMLDTLEVWCE